jgi:hypothetical protein
MSLIFASLAVLAAAASEPPCRAHPDGMALDFWLGDWAVTSGDSRTPFGDDRIELAAGGCAIIEHWKGSAGGEGRSLLSFDAREGRWDQVWVTSDTTKPGGLKRKTLIAHVGAGVRFQGEIISGVGRDLPRPDDADAA